MLLTAELHVNGGNDESNVCQKPRPGTHPLVGTHLSALVATLQHWAVLPVVHVQLFVGEGRVVLATKLTSAYHVICLVFLPLFALGILKS